MNSGEITASGKIPKDAEFFQDHFPDFPILPGVLGLDLLVQTARRHLAGPGGNGSHYVSEIRAAKFSGYLAPGDPWEARLRLVSEEGSKTRWTGRLMRGAKAALSAEWTLDEGG